MWRLNWRSINWLLLLEIYFIPNWFKTLNPIGLKSIQQQISNGANQTICIIECSCLLAGWFNSIQFHSNSANSLIKTECLQFLIEWMLNGIENWNWNWNQTRQQALRFNAEWWIKFDCCCSCLILNSLRQNILQN